MKFQSLKNFFQSKKFSRVLIGLAIIVAGLLIFQTGIMVGYSRAVVGKHLNEPFDDIFVDRSLGFLPESELPGDHGAAGTVVNIALPKIIIADVSGVEKNIIIDDDTIIRQYQTTIAPESLAPGVQVVVFGEPDTHSQIQARFIRIMPSAQQSQIPQQ